MFKIAILGPIASGKSMLANAMVDCSAAMEYRFSSELALVNRMVFGANDSLKIYPTSEAAEHGLGVLTIEKNVQSDFFRNVWTGILGYTHKDIAYVQTEYPCKLLNIGVEIADLPYPTADNQLLIYDFLMEADLVICCINFDHFSNEHFCFLEQIQTSVLFAITHFDYYRLEKEMGNSYLSSIQEGISIQMHALYSKYGDNMLFLLDTSLYIQGVRDNNMELIDRSRFLYLKAEIYRYVARSYFDRQL